MMKKIDRVFFVDKKANIYFQILDDMSIFYYTCSDE